jgi:hypothetical protein
MVQKKGPPHQVGTGGPDNAQYPKVKKGKKGKKGMERMPADPGAGGAGPGGKRGPPAPPPGAMKKMKKGPLNMEVNAATDGPNGAARPFVYNHVAKTGGSFVKNIMAQLFEDKGTILEEWHGVKTLKLPTEGPKRPFVVGAIRHPCEYYVSLWAFTSGGITDVVVGSLPPLRQYLGRDTASNFSSAEDIQRFRKWVRELSGPEFNLLSTRFWFSYFKPGNPCQAFRGDVCVGASSKYTQMTEEIRGDLASMDISKLADCWLETSSLEQDFEECLRQYEAATGVPIDWVKYRELAGNRHKNKSTRSKCEDYYDEDTMSFVMERDRHIADGFGYTTCCPGGPVKAFERARSSDKLEF